MTRRRTLAWFLPLALISTAAALTQTKQANNTNPIFVKADNSKCQYVR